MTSFALCHRRGETTKSGVVAGKAEAQQVLGPVELAAPDMLPGQRIVDCLCMAMPNQAKQRGAADNRKSGCTKHVVQPIGLRSKHGASAFGPVLVQQCREAADVPQIRSTTLG